MGGRGAGSSISNVPKYDRFSGGQIEMKTYNKLPKYIQDSVIAVDSYNPREYGYNEPNNYHIYYVDNNGVVSFFSEDGSDFLGEMRSWGRSAFGRVDDYDIPADYRYNTGDQLRRK